jgi:phospholipase A-2-activating protein
MDFKIKAFDSAGNPLMELTGHRKGIISFSWTSTGHLISGSWDGTARVWKFTPPDGFGQTWQCLYELGPHENGVHVLGLPNGHILTTSTGESVNEKPANFRIRVWDQNTGQQIGAAIEDHSGPIRGITRVNGMDGYATCSNDGSVALRSSDGAVIDSMFHATQDDGMMPFILDVTSLPTPSGLELVSCGEDGSVCVWSGNQLVQCIPHPTSVWCAVGIPNTDGDFITCAHDGVMRLFSRQVPGSPEEESRMMALTMQFETQVAEAKQKARKGPSQEEIEKATPWDERNSVQGKSEGQVMVFNKTGKMIAAQWSAPSR